MRIDFPYYQGMSCLDIPDANLIGVVSPLSHAEALPPDTLIKSAFERPIKCRPVSALARKAKKVLILTDDYTRKTPVREILFHLLRELCVGGIEADDISILVASGTHRQMTDAEMLSKFGKEVLSKYRVSSHNWRDEESLVDFGVTQSGVPVRLNRAVRSADLIIGIGQIAPHRIAGFSGGGKIIQPGISGPESAAEIHWHSAMIDGGQILGVAENPIRHEIEEVAARAGITAIANAVCDGSGKVVGMFVGDPVQAHRAGARLAREVYGVRIKERPDILVIDSYPMDGELWQAAKALYAAELIMKQGGVTILITPCQEGVSRSHPLILVEGYRKAAETIRLVEEGRISDKMVASHLVRVGRVIRDKGAGILVSQGIGSEKAEKLGFRYGRTPQEALNIAFEIAGRAASVLVVRQGGTVLPIVEGGD